MHNDDMMTCDRVLHKAAQPPRQPPLKRFTATLAANRASQAAWRTRQTKVQSKATARGVPTCRASRRQASPLSAGGGGAAADGASLLGAQASRWPTARTPWQATLSLLCRAAATAPVAPREVASGGRHCWHARSTAFVHPQGRLQSDEPRHTAAGCSIRRMCSTMRCQPGWAVSWVHSLQALAQA